MKQYTTIKLWKETRSKLKILSALTDKNMMACMDNLIEKELKKIDRNKEDRNIKN